MSYRLFIAMFFFIGLSGGCQPFIECVEFNEKETTSPDGRFVAKSKTRDCGATTSGWTSVNVHQIDKPGAEPVLAFSTKRERSVMMIWRSNTELEIKCLDCDDRTREPVVFSME